MSQLNISVNARKEVGRGSNRRLRSSGRIPAVIYSKGESRAVSLDNKEFAKLWHDLVGRTPLVTLSEGKDELMALVQEVQRHPIKDYFIHVDFFEVTRGEEITAQASLRFIGEAPGVKNDGGSLDTQLHEIEVRSRPSNIPDFIEVDVSELNVGDSIHVSDLPKIEGVSYTTHEDTLVVSVVAAMREEEPVVVEVELTEEEAEAQAQEESEESPAEEEPQ
jgi:large subunit ribosomal protein L25